VISEFAPNTTVANMMIPIVIAACNKLGIYAYPFLIPVTLACGTVFMLPLATPAIAIVYGSGYIRMRDMVKVGFLLHVIGILILTLLSYLMIGKFSGTTM
jgi:sodium-dependent dicarboxylate transporter 2/3/5